MGEREREEEYLSGSVDRARVYPRGTLTNHFARMLNFSTRGRHAGSPLGTIPRNPVNLETNEIKKGRKEAKYRRTVSGNSGDGMELR